MYINDNKKQDNLKTPLKTYLKKTECTDFF